MCYNGVVWLSKVCYNVSIADSVYYNKLCIADMLQSFSYTIRNTVASSSICIKTAAKAPLHCTRTIFSVTVPKRDQMKFMASLGFGLDGTCEKSTRNVYRDTDITSLTKHVLSF